MITKPLRFTFLLDPVERALIAELAKRLDRTLSSAVRHVVVNAAREFTQADKEAQEAQKQKAE